MVEVDKAACKKDAIRFVNKNFTGKTDGYLGTITVDRLELIAAVSDLIEKIVEEAG